MTRDLAPGDAMTDDAPQPKPNMKTESTSFRPFVRVVSSLSCLLTLITGCVGGDDDITGSESHFVRCEVDADCAQGTCEATYCEVNGERISTFGVSQGDQGGSSDADELCEVLSRTPITLADLELDRADFELAAATVPFSWSSSGWEDSLTIEPVLATSEITLEVSVLEGTAVHLERKPRVGGYLGCGPAEQVKLAYRIHTSDGMLDEAGEVTQTIAEDDQALNKYLSFALDADELGGALKVTPLRDNLDIKLNFSLWWPEPELSGAVGLTVSETNSGGGTSSASTPGGAGQFSRTGCSPLTYYADQAMRFGERALAEELADFTQETKLRGTWEDTGETTELTLSASVGSATACHNGDRLQLLTTLQLTSDDGKVRELDLEGTFHLLRAADTDAILERQATAFARLTCGESEPWALQNVSCAEYAAVDVNYAFTTYAGRGGDSGWLEFYVYTNPEAASADKVLRLALAPSASQ